MCIQGVIWWWDEVGLFPLHPEKSPPDGAEYVGISALSPEQAFNAWEIYNVQLGDTNEETARDVEVWRRDNGGRPD